MFGTRPKLFDSCERFVGVYVARTCAVRYLCDSVTHVRVLIFFVRVWLKVVGVTSRAIGLVRRGGPSHLLSVCLVAFGAGGITSMISGIRLRCVHEHIGRPEVGRVAGVTFNHSLKVTEVHSSGSIPIVACGARARCNIVVIDCRGQPCLCGVADIAFRICFYVLSLLTRGCHAVMTARAGVRHHAAVVECGRRPSVGRMTIITLVFARDVQRVFAGGRDAIVAAHTCARHLRVINL